MDLRVLGPVQVVRDDGRRIALASRAQRRLLSRLAVDAHSVVRTAILEDDLGLTASALRTSVSRLRGVVGAGHVVTSSLGYELRPTRFDVADFEGHLARARGARATEARAAIELALGLWSGDAFVDVADEPWAITEIARLTELRAGAIEDLVERLLDAGEASLALATLEHHLAAHQFREAAQLLHLRGLVALGRRTDALRAFQAHRRLLVDEVGTEPSPELVALDRAIASGQTLEWPRRDGAARRQSTRAPRLPAPLSSFVGRRKELAEVAPLIRAHRLVTLTGAGGCGKTRLALQLASGAVADHPGGVWWIELSQVDDATRLADQVALAAGLAPWGGGDLVAALRELIDGRGPALVVLDNAEHLIAAVAALVEVVATTCSDVHVLVTSREPLALAGEVCWQVPSLSAARPAADRCDLEASDSARLFLERARAARPGLVVEGADVEHVVAICDGLDGLPLALELAAAQTRTLPLDRVAGGVDDALRWLGRGTHSPLARHQTLHASIAWSVDLVGAAERSILTRLATFRGSFTLGAALAVGASDEREPDQVLLALRQLVDSSLLQVAEVSGRYRMLSTVRQFCLRRARGSADLEHARAAHSAYVARWCTEVGDGLHGIERAPFLRDMPDVVAALAWARKHAPLDALQMCAGLASVRSALGYHADLTDTWAWLMAFDRDGPRAAEWATAVAALMSSATAIGADITGLAESVAARLPTEHRRARGWLERGAAMVPAYRGDLVPIGAYADHIVAAEDDAESSIYVGFCAYMLALTGQLDECDRRVDQLRRVTRRQRARFEVDTVGNGFAATILASMTRGDLRGVARHTDGSVPDDPAFSMTAAAVIAQVGLFSVDATLLQRAIDWSRRGTIPLLRFLPTLVACCGALLADDVLEAADLAERYWREAAPVPVSRVHAIPVVTVALLAAGRADAVNAVTKESADLVAEMGDAPLLQSALHQSRAQLALHEGRADAVAQHARELLDLATSSGFRLQSVDALELLVAADQPQDDRESRARLIRAALEERATLGYRFSMLPGAKTVL